VRVVSIGNGSVDMAKDFAGEYAARIEVFTDPDRGAYKLAGMRRTFGLGVRTLSRARRAMKAGFRQGKTLGDAWQQGGVLLVSSDGAVLWESIDHGAGELTKIEELIAAVEKSAA
jgi:hypothetical protein